MNGRASQLPGALSRDCQHRRRNVDAHDLALFTHKLREPERRRARAAADVEHAFPGDGAASFQRRFRHLSMIVVALFLRPRPELSDRPFQ